MGLASDGKESARLLTRLNAAEVRVAVPCAPASKRQHLIKNLAFAAGAITLSVSASAAGIDSRAYTCADLHSLIAAQGFVFISQATFGDFVVANASFCGGGELLEGRGVTTADRVECPVNYCAAYTSGEGN
jgi:hypothetical protein